MEYVNLLAVKLAAGALADLHSSRGAIVTDSTPAVGAVHRQGAQPPRTVLARRRADVGAEIRGMLGIGWVVAWAPRTVNLAPTALATHLRDSAATSTKEAS